MTTPLSPGDVVRSRYVTIGHLRFTVIECDGIVTTVRTVAGETEYFPRSELCFPDPEDGDLSSSKPRAGERVTYSGKEIATVVHVEGNICWSKYDNTGETMPFIWKFKDGLNALAWWPSKSPTAPRSFCPGKDTV